MSISYDDKDTILYELEWQILIDRIICRSYMWNKLQYKWKISWFDQRNINIETFLSSLNDKCESNKITIN